MMAASCHGAVRQSGSVLAFACAREVNVVGGAVALIVHDRVRGKHGGEACLVGTGVGPLGMSAVGFEVAAVSNDCGRIGWYRRIRCVGVSAFAQVWLKGFHLG